MSKRSPKDWLSLFGTILESSQDMSEKQTKHSDRRSLDRSAKRLPITFYDPNEVRSHHGVLVNGSHAGAFIETNEILPLMTKIRIEGPGIQLQAEICRVHWIGPTEQSDTQHTGMAVRILPSSEQITDADYESEEGTLLNLPTVVAV